MDAHTLSRRATAIGGAVLLFSVAACDDATDPAAPGAAHTTPPAVALRSFTASPDVLAAVADAEDRVAPSLALDVREPMRAALAELRAALEAGHQARRDRATAGLRSLLAERADSAADDAADRAAVAVLLTIAVPDSQPQPQPQPPAW